VNAHNAPVTARELERFASIVTHELDRHELAPGTSTLVLAVDDGDCILMLACDEAHSPRVTGQIDQLLAPRRRMIAMVTTTGWSPSESGVSSLAWVIVAVGLGGAPACVAVRRVVEDDRWTGIPPHQVPWFLLSTASGLRAALENGVPVRLKTATATELFRRPDQVPLPPLDERGSL
jgi:hypothetical protein